MSVGPTPLEIFRAKGVPHRRLEDWKYTDLRQTVDAAMIETAGNLAAKISVPASVETPSAHIQPEWVGRVVDAVSSDEAMDAAARAFGKDVWAFRVPEGVAVPTPLRLEFDGIGQGEIVLLLERNTSLTLSEIHGTDGSGLRNISLSIVLAENAKLTHIREAGFAGELVSIETVSLVQEKGSHYRAHLLQGGAKLSRAEFNIRLDGENADTHLFGVSILGDKAHADITTRIDHGAGHTTSRQLFKKVAGGQARAIYQGKISVREGAIGSDSRQTAKALLLGARAEADLKPELEILADDVQCAHGAAVGDLDADSLFYLRARGIPESEARALLVQAFLHEVTDQFPEEAARATAEQFVDKGLAEIVSEAS